MVRCLAVIKIYLSVFFPDAQLASWHFLYREAWPGMPYQAWPELQPAELGKQDVCHLQA